MNPLVRSLLALDRFIKRFPRTDRFLTRLGAGVSLALFAAFVAIATYGATTALLRAVLFLAGVR